MPGRCPRQVLGLGDSNSFSHVLAGLPMPRVLLSRKFGGFTLTSSVISARPRAEIRTSSANSDGSRCLASTENLQLFVSEMLHLCFMSRFSGVKLRCFPAADIPKNLCFAKIKLQIQFLPENKTVNVVTVLFLQITCSFIISWELKPLSHCALFLALSAL